MILFSTFTGDRDSKTADILRDGVAVGYIEREYYDGAFQGAATFARTRRYQGTRVVFFDREEEIEIPPTTLAADLKTAKSAVRQALA